MKNSLKKLLLGGAAVLALGVGADAYAQNTDNATIPTEAIVVAPITVTLGQQLDFGSFIPGGAANGDVIIATDGSRTVPGTFFAIPSDVGQEGTFTIDADLATEFSLVASVTPLNSGGNSMNITAVSVAGGDGSTTSAVDILDTGAGAQTGFSVAGAAEVFSIGGTLDVSNTQAAGTYGGSLTLTATYQ